MQWALSVLVSAIAVTVVPNGVARAATVEHVVPTTIPADWYVIGAQDAIPQDGTIGFHLYSRDLGDRSPALAVGTLSCDGGCDQLEGRRRSVRGPGGIGASLVRSGPYTWTTWSDPAGGQDVVDVVITRGVSDDAAVAAARAARDGAIRRKGLPEGFRDRGISPVGPNAVPYGAARITFLRPDAGPGSDVVLYGTSVDASGRAALRFFGGQQGRMSHDFQPELAMSIEGDRVAVATGPADAGLATLARSVTPTDQQGWDAFRARVHDIPASVLLAGLDPGFDVVDGSTPTTRWAAAFKSDGDTITSFAVLADVDIGRVVHGSFGPQVAPGTLANLAGAWDGGGTRCARASRPPAPRACGSRPPAIPRSRSRPCRWRARPVTTTTRR